MISKTDNTLPLIVLEGLKAQNRFYTMNTVGQSIEDACKLANGEVAYRVLAYCETSDEALAVIEGDGYDHLGHFIDANREMYEKAGIDPDATEILLRRLSARDDVQRIIRTPVQTLMDARNVHS